MWPLQLPLAICDSDKMFLSMQQFFSLSTVNHTEKSNVVYLEVMDAVADCKDTIITMLHNLYQKFIEGQGLEYLLVEGTSNCTTYYNP